MARRAQQLLVLWHLLSLDAPTVATVWTWFIAKANGIHLGLTPLIAMPTAVWLLYASDRLLDARSETDHLEERHHFHNLHRVAFLTGIATASILLAILLPRLPIEAIRLYLILGGLVFGYFIAIHVMHSAHRLPKEIVVGVCFAAAVFIPTVSRLPELRVPLLIPAMLFAILCSLNCLFIYEWEHEGATVRQPPHALTATALSHLAPLNAAVGIAALLLAIFYRRGHWQISAAVTLSSVALGALHATRHRYDGVLLRSLADALLLTPLLLVAL